MKKVLLATSLLLSTALTGCVIAITPDGFDSGDSVTRSDRKMRDKIAALPLGQTQTAVRDELGEPQFTEAFNGKDGEYRVYFYRTHRTQEDGETTRDETTPLVFRDGKLIAVGMDAYRNAVQS